MRRAVDFTKLPIGTMVRLKGVGRIPVRIVDVEPGKWVAAQRAADPLGSRQWMWTRSGRYCGPKMQVDHEAPKPRFKGASARDLDPNTIRLPQDEPAREAGAARSVFEEWQ
jgi:hypothetical protein